MADEDDKVRRNLVVVSGVILGTAFLELPVSGVIDLFATAPDPFRSIPQSKFWAIGLALLAYLLARYRFSTDGKNMVVVIRNTRLQELRSLGEQEIRRAEREFNVRGTLRPSISELLNPLDDLRKGAQLSGKAPVKFKLQLNRHRSTLSNLSQITFEFTHEHAKANDGILQRLQTFGATFTSPQKFYFKCRAMLIGYAYSEGAVQQLAPVIFASLAVMTLWFRIASRIVEDWPF